MYWWKDSSSSRTYNESSSSQHIPTSGARARFSIPCAINMFNSTSPSRTGFGFSRMFEVKGNLWMNEVIPVGDTRQRNSTDYKGTLGMLPLPLKNPDHENDESYSTSTITKNQNQNQNQNQNPSKEMVVKQTGKRTRLRTAKTVDMADKDFTLPEVYDQEDSALDEFVSSVAADQFSSRELFERLEGWQIETRERKNGKFDRFYHHKKSKKMFRSLLMVKMFIKNINIPPQRARPRQKNKNAYEEGASVYSSQLQRKKTMKRKRNEHSGSDMLRGRKSKMIEDFKPKSENHYLDYFRCSEERVGAVQNQKFPFQFMRIMD